MATRVLSTMVCCGSIIFGIGVEGYTMSISNTGEVHKFGKDNINVFVTKKQNLEFSNFLILVLLKH